MKHFLSCVLCILLPIVLFSEDTGYKVACDGGSVLMIKARTTLKLYIERNQSRFAGDKEDVLTWDNGEQHGGLAIQCDKKRLSGRPCWTGKVSRAGRLWIPLL